MKKTAIVGGILLLAGLVVALAGYVLSGGDLSVVNGDVGPIHVNVGTDGGAVGFGSTGKGERRDEPASVPAAYEPVSYEYSGDEVQLVDVSERAANIFVEPSRDGKVHLTLAENQRRSYSVTCQGGVLRVKCELRSAPSGGSHWESAEVHLSLPDGVALDIENDAGNVSISGLGLLAAELDIDAGNIELSELTVDGKLSLGCDAGNVKLSGVEAGVVYAENDAGNIVFDVVTARNMEAECSMGEIIAEDVTAGTLVLENDCGNIQLDGAAARESMSLNCSLGNVSGTLRGSMDDYAIASDVDLGENNLPESTRGGVTLTVDVDCGNIDIEFEED